MRATKDGRREGQETGARKDLPAFWKDQSPKRYQYWPVPPVYCYVTAATSANLFSMSPFCFAHGGDSGLLRRSKRAL